MHLEMDLLILVLILSKSVGVMMEIKCINCRYFRLHELHDDVGMCMNKGSQFFMRMVMADWQCPFFTEFDREGEEFYWCVDCRTMVHKSMLPLHNGHRLVNVPYIDEESHLETYVAD